MQGKKFVGGLVARNIEEYRAMKPCAVTGKVVYRSSAKAKEMASRIGGMAAYRGACKHWHLATEKRERGMRRR